MDESNHNSGQISSAGDKFVPTCDICGGNHWPLDPSCIGKKAVKENAKRKAKEAKIALKKAAIAAKNEKKHKKIEAKREITQIKAAEKSEKNAKFEAMAKAKKHSEALVSAEMKLQTEANARAKAEEEARLQAEKYGLLETGAQCQIDLHTKEISSLKQKLQKSEGSLLKEKTALLDANENIAIVKLGCQETISKIKSEISEAETARQFAEQKFKSEMEDKAGAHEKALASAKNELHRYAEDIDMARAQLVHAEINAKKEIESKVAKEIQKRREIDSALKLKEDAMAENMAMAKEELKSEAEKRFLSESQYQGQIKLYSTEISSLKQKLHDTEKSLLKEKAALLGANENTAKIKAKYQEATATIKIELEEVAAKESSDSANKLHLLKESFSKIESENERTIVNLKKEFKEQIAIVKINAEEAVANEKDKVAREVQKAVSKIRPDADRSIADIQSRCDDEINNVISEAEAARQFAEQRFKSEMEDKTRSHEKAFASVKNKLQSYAEDLDLARTQHGTEIASLKRQIQENEKSLLQERTALLDAKEDVAKIKAEHQETVAIVKMEANEAIAKERTAAEIAERWAEKIKAESDATIARLNSDASKLNDTIVKINSKTEEKVLQAGIRAEKSMGDAKKKADDRIAKFKVKMQQAVANEKTDSAKKLGLLKESLSKLESENEQATISLKNKYEEHIAILKTESEEAIAMEKSNSAKEALQHKESISKIKSDAERSIFDIQSECAKEIVKVNAEAEKSCRLIEDKLKSEMETKARGHETALAKIANKAKGFAEELKQVKIQLKAEIKEKKKAANQVRKEISKRTGIEATFKLKENAVGERIARAEEKTKAKAEKEARAQIEKLLVAEAQERAKITVEMEDKVESFAEKITAIKTESERAIAEAKLRASENNELSSHIRQEAQAKARRIEFFDHDGFDAKKDRKQSAASEGVLGERGRSVLSVCAQDIMRTEIVWCSKEDSVENALEQMRQQDVGYMLVGENGIVSGIVSKSDLKGALSPYLQPQFAKWRRPLDDATLQIRIKWVMSKSVHTVGCETELATILNEIRQLDVMCFPVIDESRQVVGILTKAEIFDTLATANNEAVDKTPSFMPYQVSPV